MKKIYFLVCLFLLIGLFGCISGNTSEQELKDLQIKFGAEESLPTNLIKMESYLNELSILKSKNQGLWPLLDSEIIFAQSFYYFSKALDESKSINYMDHCNSIEYKNTLNYLNLAIKYSQKNSGFETFLRPNQAQIINEINASSKEMLSFLEETC